MPERYMLGVEIEGMQLEMWKKLQDSSYMGQFLVVYAVVLTRHIMDMNATEACWYIGMRQYQEATARQNHTLNPTR